MRTARITVVFLALAGLCPTSQVRADDGMVRLRGIVTNVDYTLQYDDSTTSRAGTSRFTAAGLGLTYVWSGGMYADAKYLTSSNATHDYWRTAGFASLPLERADTTLTWGYTTADLWNVHAALQNGKTKRTNQPGNLEQSRTLTTQGVVAGGGKGFATGIGVFGVNGTVGLVSGTLDTSTGVSSKADSALALSAGASYAYPYSRNLVFGADAKLQKFTLDFGKGGANAFSYAETIKSLSIYIAGQF